jgi:MoxR-like ATPase
MADWKIFRGTGQPHAGIEHLPEPPSWRAFSQPSGESADVAKDRGATFQARPEAIQVVNAALYLRRPLLVTGKPGTGKTSLAYAVAHELQLGEVLYWPVTTKTDLKQGLYSYDAIGRLQDAQAKGGKDNLEDNLAEIGNYITLGPLGTALLPSAKPRVLLIDEIDKSDIDLPNDLLHVLEEGRFGVPELERIAQKISQVTVRTAYKDPHKTTIQDAAWSITEGQVTCTAFPFVVMTSNGERDFPPPFLRRCVRLSMKEPDEQELARIVAAHLGAAQATEAQALIDDMIKKFIEKRGGGDLATDQLLNALYLLTQDQVPTGQEKEDLEKYLFKYLTSAEDV